MLRPVHTDPATYPTKVLEHNMVRSNRLASICRRSYKDDEALLHATWVDILLDEWSRRKLPADVAEAAAA